VTVHPLLMQASCQNPKKNKKTRNSHNQLIFNAYSIQNDLSLIMSGAPDWGVESHFYNIRETQSHIWDTYNTLPDKHEG
jgi:hypothetical protein